MWTVYATPPTNLWNGWSFRDGFFPRTVYGKVHAERLAEEARREGATDVRVEKAKHSNKG